MSNSKLKKDLSKFLPQANISTDKETCYVYSFDASNENFDNSMADAVIFVRNIDEVQQVVKYANTYKIPLICRGAGTNTVGACTPICGGIVMNFAKMNKILELNSDNMTATVESGVIVGDLQAKAQEVGLFYPPDPSNLKVSTIGGSIAQNSAGARCFKYGATKDYILDMLVVTADGNIVKTGSNTIKNASGYNLGSLFIGSEGTLGVVVQATVKLIPKPQATQVIMAYFDSINSAIQTVNDIISAKLFPSTIDFMDFNAIRTVEEFSHTGLLTDKNAALIIETDGTKSSLNEQKEAIYRILQLNHAAHVVSSTNDKEAEAIWSARRSSMAACTRLKPNVATDDIIVPRNNLAQLVEGVNKICAKYNLTVCMVGHVGDGSIHPQIPIDFTNEQEYKAYKFAKSEIYDLTVSLGGTISAEHGIGLLKKPYLGRVANKGSIELMRQIKKIFDPNNILNPYKIF